MKSFKVGYEKIKVSNAAVDFALKASGKIDLGKIQGERRYGFICLRCKGLRCGKRDSHGRIHCGACGLTMERLI